jgi:plastocyanin
MRRSRLIYAASAALLAAAIACGGNGSSNPGTPTIGSGSTTCTAPSTSTTITISNNSVCPQNITVARGTQVTFVNSDTRRHEMTSDPHPEHTDCPELNQVGNLEVGQSRQSGNLNTVRRCGFHDHLQDQVQALKGAITIQ